MRNGDISNIVAPYVYFEFDTLLLYEEKKYKNIFGLKIPAGKETKVDKQFSRMLQYLLMKHDVNIILFTTKKYSGEQRDELVELLFKNKVVYSRIEIIESLEELRKENFIYLFSDKESTISYMSRNEARHIDDFAEVFR